MPTHAQCVLAPAVALFLAASHPAAAAGDLTVSRLNGLTAFGAVDGIHAYAFGFDACNTGDTPLDWIDSTSRHPVLASQLYRLSEGRIEQIGLSFVFHEFFPLQLNTCGGCVPPTDPQALGVGCATTNSSGIAGAQVALGSRTEIDPVTGIFPFPPAQLNESGNAVFKRLQASGDDLSIPGARYFFEGQYITQDDAAAGNGDNNASHREAVFSPGALSASFIGETIERMPAIYAWRAADPDVQIAEVDAPDGGRYIVASRAVMTDAFEWRYEYAVYNQNSAQNAVAFEAPHPGVTDFSRAFDESFHDVDYHSGDAVDGTDWTDRMAAFSTRWDVVPPAPLAALPNGIRWGTLYNFGYTSIDPPVDTQVRIQLDNGESIWAQAVASGESRCGEADFAEPYFVLDLADLQAYIGAFIAGEPEADIRAPLGVLDLADLQAFVGAFISGCP